MTFRQSVLALTAPILSLAIAGCNPPVEPDKGTGTAAPSTGDSATKTPAVTPEPGSTDVKTKPEMTPSPEMPKEGAPPAADVKPEPSPTETPK